jgi:hypothetical protein
MEIDTLSPKMMSISSFHVSLWRTSVFLVSAAVRCNADRCYNTSLFIIRVCNFSCVCLCAFDCLVCIAVVVIVMSYLSFSRYIPNNTCVWLSVVTRGTKE